MSGVAGAGVAEDDVVVVVVVVVGPGTTRFSTSVHPFLVLRSSRVLFFLTWWILAGRLVGSWWASLRRLLGLAVVGLAVVGAAVDGEADSGVVVRYSLGIFLDGLSLPCSDADAEDEDVPTAAVVDVKLKATSPGFDSWPSVSRVAFSDEYSCRHKEKVSYTL